jgi:ATP-dependent DNA helicase RecQ
VYVAPERLQIAGFLRELRSVGADHPIGLLVVDEAHCVSEWGHDFRPAYLRIPRLRQELQEVAGRTIPIVGLTATASRLVRADILATLELSEADVVQETTSDRPNLSYSVHTPADLGASDKAFALVRFLRERLPRTLRSTPDRLYYVL